MAPIRNARVYYAAQPTGVHVKYDDSNMIDLDAVQLNGGILLKTLCISIDPYMRNRMLPFNPKVPMPVFELNQSMNGDGIAKVIRSEDDAFKPGDIVAGSLLHQEYVVYSGTLNPDVHFIKLEDIGLPWSVYTGVLGMAGQTAFYGWKAYSKAKTGETAFVTTAAGAVGSLVVQLAKRDGLCVIASSGSDEKAAFSKECGADVSFNYKKENVWDVLEREGKGIDVYFDNVGGEHLDAALLYAARFARFIQCGGASQYNGEKPYPITNTIMINQKELSLNGLLYFTHRQKYEKEFFATLPHLVKNGAIKYREDVSRGLDTVGQALNDVGTGRNSGKRVVVVADD